MSTPPQLDIESELRRQLAEARSQQLSEFDPQVLSRLALVPEWTSVVAEPLGLASFADIGPLLDRLERADLIERREVLAPDGGQQHAFWLRSTRRSEVAGYLQRIRGIEGLESDLARLAFAAASVRSVPAGIRVWVEVVTRHRRDPSGAALINRVDELAAAERLAEAATMVATAQSVGEVVGGPLASAARRAQWRVDRAHRTAEDAYHLRHYYPRREAEQAIDELLAGTGEWALHLLGMGGVGKTMAIRYLASGRYAEDRGMGVFPVARADFDRLDPRYPEQRPAELLLALVGELTGFGVRRASYSAYRGFLDATDAVHEEFARSGGDPARQDELLRQTVMRFAEFLDQLPSPVVLVLDTCEELAKLYALGASAPAIDRTFQLLEMLRDHQRDVRVVLAGRRRLAPGGEDDAGRPPASPLLLSRPYVRVLQLEGYTREEAVGYLAQREAARLTRLRPELRAALLDRAREPGRGSAGGDGRDRYNPFVLAGYCEWAFSEPGLDPRQLRAAPGDPYVERRIIGRLGDDPVRAALAAAVELGRFDLDLIAPSLRRTGIDPAAAFDGLAGQEWINVRSVTTDGRPRVIEVDEHLRGRIRAVTKANPAQFPVDRQALGRDAAAVVERTPLAELPAETVEAAVHLLPVAAAAVFWQRLEQRIVAEDAWGWAAQVTARVGAIELGAAERHGPDGPTVVAAILATQAAARVHAGAQADRAALWQAVAAAAHRHPDPPVAATLRARAALGRIAAGDDAAGVDSVPDTGAAPAGSVAAALESWPPGTPLPRLPSDETDDPAVAAMVALAQATAALPSGDLDAAARACEVALAAAEQAATQPVARWADWVAPRRLADRCRIVRLLVALRRGDALEDFPWPEWRAAALSGLGDIDAERLAALTFRFELAHRVVPAKVLAAAEEAARRVPAPPRPAVPLHQSVRPLVVELADGWSVLGEPLRARDLLVERREAAVAAGDDPDVIDLCELALLRLCRRYRTTELAPSVHRLAHEGSAAIRAEARVVLTLVNGEVPESPPANIWGFDVLVQAARTAATADALPLAQGRALLEEGEVLALWSPARGAGLLLSAAEQLERAGDQLGAAHAGVLAVLAAARADEPAMARAAWYKWGEGIPRRSLATPQWSGWWDRWRVVEAYVSGRPPLEVSERRSPELDLTLRAPDVPAQAAPAPVGGTPPPPSAYDGALPPSRPLAGRLRRRRFVVIALLLAVLLGAAVAALFGPVESAVPGAVRPGASPDGLLGRVLPWVGGAALVLLLAAAVVVAFLRSWRFRMALDSGVPYGGLTPRQWRSAFADFRGPRHLAPTLAGQSSEVAGDLGRISYVVGTPVKTAGGWRLRVADASGLPGAGANQASRGSIAGEELLNLEEPGFVRTMLLVLQADPVDGPPQPLGKQREGFLSLARTAFGSHSDAVLVIPPLPDDLAAAVVKTVWQKIALRQRAPSASELAALRARVKAMVADREDVTSGESPPSADVMFLYSRTRALYSRARRADD
jgi:hypothetical protein